MNLDFEQEIDKIECQINELEKLGLLRGINYSIEICQLQKQRAIKLKRLYSNLTAWQTVQVARHPNRPLFIDYLNLMVKDFRELHGDKCFGDDKSMIAGFGRINAEKVMFIGQNKGKNTKQKIACNFGCTNPEGYRKALAKMKLAEKFGIPIITFIDTPGAYPGIGAEERGQAYVIANNLNQMVRLKVPVISVIIGEGCSGGALGIGVADKLAILEFAYYSVISPEGCAAILWRDSKQYIKAAKSLKLTSSDAYKFGVVDDIIQEPEGGAHRNYYIVAQNIKKYILETLQNLKRIKTDNLINKRYKKLRAIGNKI